MFAQSADTDITGLWKGTLYNDSTHQFYKYEIGISEEKGKLTGFSHTWFLLDDKQYYGLKKVKVKRKDGKVIIEDDGLIANNYPVAPAKGIRQLNVLVLDTRDSIMTLSGPFTTNRTKEYAPLTGTIDLQRKNDYWQSALIPHLQELNLVNTLSFMNDDKLMAQNNIIIAARQPITVVAKNTIIENKTQTPDVKSISPPEVKEDMIAKNKEVRTEAGNNLALPKEPERKEAVNDPIVKTATTKNSQDKNEITKNEVVKQMPVKTAIAKNEDPKNQDPKSTVNDIARLNTNKSDTVYSIASVSNKPVATAPVNPGVTQSNNENTIDPASAGIVKNATVQQVKKEEKTVEKIANITPLIARSAAADVERRTTLLQQTVSFHSDSLQISLYDNGEVDGDTVSVLMNGNIIMAKERLSTNAVRKTIYIPRETDSIQLVMYAENLGLIPPNTGLLVVKDGKDLYEIRFSGDLQKNAAILLRRKKKDQ
ncbi:hypothetical protein EGI32_00930 [Ferruginibacter sp. HRS2-29]|nr:hypothetical protein [Ferruginibacter sp. HRS2-29]